MQGQYDNTNKGGGWITTSSKGVQYINVKVNIDGVEHKMSIFKNTYKKSEKQPDYNIIVNKPKNNYVSPEQAANSLGDNVPF